MAALSNSPYEVIQKKSESGHWLALASNFMNIFNHARTWSDKGFPIPTQSGLSTSTIPLSIIISGNALYLIAILLKRAEKWCTLIWEIIWAASVFCSSSKGIPLDLVINYKRNKARETMFHGCGSNAYIIIIIIIHNHNHNHNHT